MRVKELHFAVTDCYNRVEHSASLLGFCDIRQINTLIFKFSVDIFLNIFLHRRESVFFSCSHVLEDSPVREDSPVSACLPHYFSLTYG